MVLIPDSICSRFRMCKICVNMTVKPTERIDATEKLKEDRLFGYMWAPGFLYVHFKSCYFLEMVIHLCGSKIQTMLADINRKSGSHPCLYSLCFPLLTVFILLLFIFKMTSKYKCIYLFLPLFTQRVIIAETSNAHQYSCSPLPRRDFVCICMTNWQEGNRSQIYQIF